MTYEIGKEDQQDPLLASYDAVQEHANNHPYSPNAQATAAVIRAKVLARDLGPHAFQTSQDVLTIDDNFHDDTTRKATTNHVLQLV